ncbi:MULTISPECIES: anthranilate synthase component II [Mammaliicoccus]|uniref:Aminodeoxychorismate/anthranilate synthase component II n=1 Tax=Mammaliicoccus vitulinus TaxID=71237 RepID=A0A2T4PUM5_9STAP|nr:MULTISPECIES: aminodeoxychorismate/anthranilate synthase component II [Mammaliicoccus]MBM6630388.1 aminodeoxychorismate/anthranilate synthase component II [Mammaliicoccus vitulinus]MBO3077038.1 aminodeoxychorismate/anthranilate synthase component II [Mammaliicoccus vitulinus]MEB7656705.1 aminodeoxychorismate/anthranilate synthase component II [Mammaliicoccus vitulinus]PNZ36270.1 glutamine amidotransferase [Mammaliicoccus vitulinus]PTI30100.1 aminodeoxychorismate/anthranilate synthase compon
MILVIDNYDSFTYNLVDLIKQFEEVVIYHPDEAPLNLEIDGLVISPGPGHPEDTDDLRKIIDAYKDKPILGICLGAQALTTYYGGKVIVGKEVKHGKVDQINLIDSSILYEACEQHFKIMRYHSLISDEATFPSCLKVTGRTIDAIQSFEHINKPHFGIQYHPESFASEYGREIIKAFINTMTEGANNEHFKTTHSIS